MTRSLSLLCAVTGSKSRKDIQAYACIVSGKGEKELFKYVGSRIGAFPNRVMFDVLVEALDWLEKNVKPKDDLTIYVPYPDMLIRVDMHPAIEGTLELRNTIYARLAGLEVKFRAKPIQDSSYVIKFAETLKVESLRPLDEILVEDANMFEMKGEKGFERVWWNGRMCGSIRGKRYVSERTDKHFCIKYQAWGVQRVIVDRLVRAGIETIEIWYKGAHGLQKLVLSLDDFIEFAIPDALSGEDGRQLFVPDWKWKREG